MSVPNVIDFKQAIEKTKDKNRSLLIGNGFSADYFAYRNLLEHAGFGSADPISQLFEKLNTFDFELVIRALEDAAVVEDAYNFSDNFNIFHDDANRVRKALVKAVREAHPTSRNDPNLDYIYPARFLRHFTDVFSLNYDLLLYWVNLEKRLLTDGFRNGENRSGFRGPFEKTDCKMFNLHGGLHLFLRSDGQIEKRISEGKNLLIDNITDTILDDKKLPLYVAEGRWEAKMKKINSVAYLRHCYDQLKSSEGVLFIYGHSADDSDSHIYDAVFNSRIEHIYYSIHKFNKRNLNGKKIKLDNLQNKFKRYGKEDIHYTFFDASSAEVWKASN